MIVLLTVATEIYNTLDIVDTGFFTLHFLLNRTYILEPFITKLFDFFWRCFFGKMLITPQSYVQFDFPRCQMKCLNMLDSMVNISLGSPPALVVKIDTKQIIWLFLRFFPCLNCEFFTETLKAWWEERTFRKNLKPCQQSFYISLQQMSTWQISPDHIDFFWNTLVQSAQRGWPL